MSSLILASASPQRKELLAGLGYAFEVIPSRIDEASCPEKDPAKRAVCLASLKARDIASLHPGKWVIGCDTLVVAPNGILLEKPTDAEDARRMIKLQSGGVSIVHSGLSLIDPKGTEQTGLSSSSVQFRSLSDAEISEWIDRRIWEGRSGAFQIDGLGQMLISRLEGDFTSVVGLPVFLLGELMRKMKCTL